MNLISFIMNESSGIYGKIDLFISLALNELQMARYKDATSKKSTE